MSDFNTFEKLGESCEICVTKEHTFGTDAFLLADFAKARHKDCLRPWHRLRNNCRSHAPEI